VRTILKGLSLMSYEAEADSVTVAGKNEAYVELLSGLSIVTQSITSDL
jgi:hypothetical protein